MLYDTDGWNKKKQQQIFGVELSVSLTINNINNFSIWLRKWAE